ncbi:MAG: zinc ABC transporter substrate-binding protein [Verrucomicrobiales bacterium]|nr:zinc ABC transporter substrate-binding protein [Verrucomicrobiales bacterium]
MNTQPLPRRSLSLWFQVVVACALWGAGPTAVRAELKVATLHPLMTDLAKQVGGSHVSVTGLMSPGENIHQFSPSSSDMAAARSADVVLASGKGLETYLPRLRSTLGSATRIVEAGSAVPSIKISAKDALFVCCPQHAVGGLDPHWWHSISGMKKAATFVGKEFGKADPANAKAYQANAAAYGQRLDALSAWAKRELSRVPRSGRVLVTGHAAFAYFCKEFGFRSLPVAGLSEESVGSQYLAEAIAQIQKNGVRTIFPEQGNNTRAISSVAKSASVGLGRALIADGSASEATTYEAFIRHNIGAIAAGLGGGAS